MDQVYSFSLTLLTFSSIYPNLRIRGENLCNRMPRNDQPQNAFSNPSQRSKTPFSKGWNPQSLDVREEEKERKGDKEKRWKEAIGYGWIFWAWQFRLIEGPHRDTRICPRKDICPLARANRWTGPTRTFYRTIRSCLAQAGQL